MSDCRLLSGKRVAILVEDEFEDRELTGPLEALRAAGATVTIVGPTAAHDFTASAARRSSRPISPPAPRGCRDFDALVIPGGHAPDKMRMRHAMVDLARDAMEAGKPVAAICHGPQLLISANALRGRTLTCWPSIAIDVKNAGGLLRRQAGRRGRQPDHVAQAGRRAGVQRRDHPRAASATTLARSSQTARSDDLRARACTAARFRSAASAPPALPPAGRGAAARTRP